LRSLTESISIAKTTWQAQASAPANLSGINYDRILKSEIGIIELLDYELRQGVLQAWVRCYAARQ
jgi:hypothetical protein